MLLVAARSAAREARGVAASSAYSEAQKPNSSSPLLVQSVPDTWPLLRPSMRVLVRNLSLTSSGMAPSSDPRHAA